MKTNKTRAKTRAKARATTRATATTSTKTVAVNLPSVPLTKEQSYMPGADWLADQDKAYADRRLPYATPAGAEDRTFSVRVECDHDRRILLATLEWAIQRSWTSPICPTGDADVKMTLKSDTLALNDLRWLFDRIVDLHVAVETVELSANYTGERRFIDRDDLVARPPSANARMNCARALSEYASSLCELAQSAIEVMRDIGPDEMGQVAEGDEDLEGDEDDDEALQAEFRALVLGAMKLH